jgi:hypothetical protein
MNAIDLNELWPYKIEKTKLDNYVEFLFGYGYQEDKYYVLQYKKDKRDSGILSHGMGFEEARDFFQKIVDEENQLGDQLDLALTNFKP